MSGPHVEEPRLPLVVVELCCDVLRLHTDDPETGLCPTCHDSTCECWQWASGELRRAGYGADGQLLWADLVRPDTAAQPADGSL